MWSYKALWDSQLHYGGTLVSSDIRNIPAILPLHNLGLTLIMAEQVLFTADDPTSIDRYQVISTTFLLL